MATRIQPSEVWRKARKNRPRTKNVDVGEEIDMVLHYLANHEPDLYSGWPLPARSEDEIVQLARDLSYRAPEENIRVRFAFLADGFVIGNRDYGWQVPVLPQLVRINKPDNWATEERLAKRLEARKFERAYGLDLEKPLTKDPDVLLGKSLFSAMMFGALLERKWLPPFLEAVASRQFFQYHGILWIEMVLEQKRALPDSEETTKTFLTRRFFPDHFTQSLFYRTLDLNLIPSQTTNQSCWNLLSLYLKRLPGLRPEDIPKTLGEFLELCICRNLFLPGSMLSFATGKIRSTSLPVRPWLRCISGRSIPVTRPLSETHRLKVVTPKILDTRPRPAKDQEKIFSCLMKELTPKGEDTSPRKARDILDKYLKNHRAEINPSFQLMLHWGKQLLDKRASYLERRRKKDPVKVSTLRRYLRAIDTSLLLAAGDENLTKIDPSELELIYEEALDNRPEDAMAPQCLGQFHGYLETFFSLPPLESLELKSRSALATNDNANLITPKVYDLTLTALGWKKPGQSRWQRLGSLALILCYRCGFRPSEVRNLRTWDIQNTGPGAFEIIVRLNTKTNRGKRRVPASHLLNELEIQHFFDYLNQRRSEIGLFGEDWLFAHPDQKSGRLADSDLFDPIRKVVKAITRDETLRLYHARHTFNSALQCQFMLKGKPLLNDPGFLKLGCSKDQDEVLRNILMGNENWGRKDQHVQAILVGHSSPQMTNRYYNHLNDVLLGTLVRQRRDHIPVSLKTIMSLGDLSRSRADELFTDETDAHPLSLLTANQSRRWEDVLQHPLLAESSPMKLPLEGVVREHPLPAWEKAIETRHHKVLKRGEANWDMARLVYEGVRGLNGKRLKTAKKVLLDMHQQMETTKHPWRGPTYTSFTMLNTVLELLRAIGIAKRAIHLVHHPRYGQPGPEQDQQRLRWQESIKVEVDRLTTGKVANLKDSPSKGVVEVRIVTSDGKGQKTKKQRSMNRGFEVAISLLAQHLPRTREIVHKGPDLKPSPDGFMSSPETKGGSPCS